MDSDTENQRLSVVPDIIASINEPVQSRNTVPQTSACERDSRTDSLQDSKKKHGKSNKIKNKSITPKIYNFVEPSDRIPGNFEPTSSTPVKKTASKSSRTQCNSLNSNRRATRRALPTGASSEIGECFNYLCLIVLGIIALVLIFTLMVFRPTSSTMATIGVLSLCFCLLAVFVLARIILRNTSQRCISNITSVA